MKCKKCGYTWTSKNNLFDKICPACNEIQIKIHKYDNIYDAINFIYNTFSVKVFENKNIFLKTLNICLPECKKECNAVKLLFDTGIVKKLLNCSSLPALDVNSVIRRCVYQLQHEYGINTVWANYVVYAFLNGMGITQNGDEFIEFVETEKMAQNGNSNAQYQLAMQYKRGTLIDKSNVIAKKWLKKSAEQGNSDATYELSNMYRENSDLQAANYFLEKAVKLGNDVAMIVLAEYYYAGINGYIKDIEKSINLYENAYKRQNINASKALAKIYINDYKDYDKAYFYLDFAIKNNDTEALVILSWHKIINSSDLNEKMRYKSLLDSAVKAGNMEACYKMALLYEGKYGIKQNSLACIRLYTEAAKGGLSSAAKRLGEIYLNGLIGIEAQFDEAKEWYATAAMLGDEDAKRMFSYKNKKSPFTQSITLETYDGEEIEYRIVNEIEYNDKSFLIVKSKEDDSIYFIHIFEKKNGDCKLEIVDDSLWSKLIKLYESKLGDQL